jgi:hypothetical protein
MKKIIFFLLLVSSISFSSAASVGDISLSFCTTWSDGRSLNFVLKAGDPYPFCVRFTNASQEEVPIEISFVNGEVTSDESKKKACSTQWDRFSPYVTFPSRKILLGAWSWIVLSWIISYPLWYFGPIHGCLAYTIPKKTPYIQQDSSFLDIIVRKVNFIDWYVVWTFKRDITFLPSNIVYYEDKLDNSFVVSLIFDNKGIIPELFRFRWSLSNALGYGRSLSSAQELYSETGTVIVFRFSDFPFYKWLYRFSFEGESNLDSQLDLSYVPEKDKQALYFSYEKMVVLVPWTIVFALIWFFLALFFLRSFLKFILRR